MRHDVLFEAEGFNSAEPKAHFINECCFGDDVAAWLRCERIGRGHPTTVPGQEDWGWYVQTTVGADRYFIGVGCTGASDANPARAEWRPIIKKQRSVWQKLTGKNRLAADETVFGVLYSALVGNPDVDKIRRE